MFVIPEGVLDWTLMEIQGYSHFDSEVQHAYNMVLEWSPVLLIKKSMQPGSFWQVTVEKKIVGDGAEYRTFNTTHWVLAYLAEYGLTRSESFVELAANRYLGLQKQDGDFWRHLSCLYGLNLHTFAKLGFLSDSRLQNTLALALSSIRYDNGYLCDLHAGKKRKGSPLKSCYRGSQKVLFGLAEYPSTWNSPAVKGLVDYFLNRQVLFKKNQLTDLAVQNAGALVFPFTYREGLIDVMYPLVKMGYGNRPELARAWAILDAKRTPERKFPLDWSPANKYLKPGKTGEPNKWTTFYAYLLDKLKGS